MRIKEIVLGIAIIVLTIFVTFYGINTIFPKPNYDDFCGKISYDRPIENNSTCVAEGGKWVYNAGPKVVGQAEGYCDLYYYCNQEYNDLSKDRSKKVFFLALPIGVLIIAVGAFFFGLEAVGAGLMGGGIGTLIYGSGAYWPYTENWIRFIISLAGLVLLIWLAYYFNKKFREKKKK